ncbi:MAG TPA: glycosyl hydrolase [Vicinamibacteria bacterium]|jgi:xylan 1,4-beta-xylosidase
MGAIEFRCDLSEKGVPFPHSWEHTVGSCHAPLALRSDWQDQLRRCHRDLGFRHVRFHGLLSDIGTLVDQQNQRLESFFNADGIVDFLLRIGMKPFVELSFMPEALSSGSGTVFSYRANVTPPRDYKAWAALIESLVRHWVDRYGIQEVKTWFFEVWNEPNLKAFWKGNRESYFRLYRSTAEAIKKVDSSLRVGGPATARDEWIEEFVGFCQKRRVPVDFVSTHHYPTDALWNVDTDTEAQLAGSRRSLLRQWAQDSRRRARGLPLYYTEWNTSSNPRDPLHDQSYAAAFVVKTVMEASELVEGYSFWTFSDIFEENYFPSVPFHGGFGLLTLHGIPKPTFRAFELLHRLGRERLLVDGMHDTVDAWVVREGRRIVVLLTNHALPRHAIERERVRITLVSARKPRRAQVERIDENHANPRRLWIELGEPGYLDAGEVRRLERASKVSREPLSWRRRREEIQLELVIPPYAVASITLELDGR